MMKALVLVVLLSIAISLVGCEKKDTISIKGPSGETASITY